MTSMEETVEQNKRKAEDEADEIEVKKLKTSPAKQTNGNSKSELSSMDKDIVRQIEYYFGDINLPRDKFILEQIKQDDGWILMSVMLKFQRLAKLTTDPKVIAKALGHSQLMEVDESGEEIKIRRSPEHPLPEINEERRRELQERTIYCKGFPLDSVIDDVIKFFADYGPVENIIMRKYKEVLTKTYKFKGSVFVTFGSKEKAKEFLDLENVKVGEVELKRLWQLEYVEQKKKEILEYKMNRKGNKAKEAVKETESHKEEFAKGATLHLKGEFKDVTREVIKHTFTQYGFDTAFVSFNKGEVEAYVRLHELDSGKKLMEKVGGDIEIKKCKYETRLLEGEEEETFLKKAKEDRDAYLKKCQYSRQFGRKNKGKKGNKGHYKGKQSDGGRRRKESPEDGESPGE